jgi:hypothetical protein
VTAAQASEPSGESVGVPTRWIAHSASTDKGGRLRREVVGIVRVSMA